MRPVLNLELPALPAAVSEARTAVTEVCLQLGIDVPLREEIRLAVTEACSNCVLHAYDGDGSGTFTIQASVARGALCVSVGDSGAGMPDGWPTDDRRSKAGLGYGLRLIRMLASEVEVESNHGRGTCVTMRFALPKPGLTPPGMLGKGVATGC